MRKLIEFIRSVYVVVLFVLFEVVAVSYYARSTYYTQARLLSRSSQVLGGVQRMISGVGHYFTLGRENRQLLSRITQLEERLSRYDEAANKARLDEYMADIGESKYQLNVASVVSNSINRPDNMIVLNRGRLSGIRPEMAVLSPDGAMVGYVVKCTDRYSVVLSILNTSFRASGKLVGTDFFGSIYWDGRDQNTILLGDISKYAKPMPGQEVVSAASSLYFQPDVLIGWVENFSLNETHTSYTIRVRLAAEISRLTDVVLVKNRDLNEIRELEKSDTLKHNNYQN